MEFREPSSVAENPVRVTSPRVRTVRVLPLITALLRLFLDVDGRVCEWWENEPPTMLEPDG
jgi:hypothetical protein